MHSVKKSSGNFNQNSSKLPVIEFISGKWVMRLAGFEICFVFDSAAEAVTSQLY